VKISDRVRSYPSGFRERQAARDRLPSWAKFAQLLLQFTIWPLFGFGWFALFREVFHLIHPQLRVLPMPSSSTGVIVFSALFGTIPLTLLAVNLVLCVTPQLRRANETAAGDVPGVTFRTAMEDLLSIALISTPICMIAGLVGAWGPWL